MKANHFVEKIEFESGRIMHPLSVMTCDQVISIVGKGKRVILTVKTSEE